MDKNHIFLSKPTIVSLVVSSLATIGLLGIAWGVPKDQMQIAGVCSAATVNSATFIRTNHVRDNTDAFGVLPLKDGGYVVTGDTIWTGGMQAPYPFIVKTDVKGNKLWSKTFSSPSNALGALSSRHVGRISVETTDGNIITASDVIDFVNNSVKELYGDILLTKFNAKGTQIWSLMLGDYSIDRPRKLWALPNGGVLLLARFMKTGYGDDVADTDTVPKYSALIQIDKNGKVQSSKKMSWDAIDMERLVDGSIIALANISIPKGTTIGAEVAMTDLPTMIKLNSAFDVEWSKTMEMIPSTLNTPTVTGTTITLGKTTIRMMGGDFSGIQPAPDGGFVAFGYDNLLLTQGLSGNIKIDSKFYIRPFIAVKVDAAGNYQWAKKLTGSLYANTSANDFHVVKTADGSFVIMQDVSRDGASIAALSADFAQKEKAMLDKCAELGAIVCLDYKNLPAEVQPLADAVSAAVEVLSKASATNINLIKTDADFNPMWIKKLDVERNLSGYALQPTTDRGVVIGASMLTTKMRRTLSGMEPYTEAALIKVDVNGNASGCGSVSDHPAATLEDQTSYLIMQTIDAGNTEAMSLNINKKVKERVSNAKNAVRELCQYQKVSVTPSCSYLTGTPGEPATPGQPVTPPVAKGWALINYENTTAVGVDGEKNLAIDAELLPILNQLFNNQVKVKDNMKSMWITYIFSRLVTAADVTAVQKKYEALGYKIDDSDGTHLNVSKVGRTLHMTFSVQSSMTGKVEVLIIN